MAKKPLTVDTLTHDEASRRNAPTAELEAFVPPDVKAPIRAAYERRNPDLDPQLVWRGKDVADWSDLIVEAPPLYIQEKIHPKALVEDLKRATTRKAEPDSAPDLFADFNGIEPDQRTEFYAHDQHWSNRMILGDGLKVMASLAEREGLKGQVQCIYIDPPYGIKFNSNFQWSTTSRDVKDGKADHFSREPEQVKAFRDTWADGIHSYLTYLRDRLTVARDLLTESGSVFVQIGDENVHRVRALMDEVFGEENHVSTVSVQKTYGFSSDAISNVCDYLVWFSRNRNAVKIRQLYAEKPYTLGEGNARWLLLPDFTYRGVSAVEQSSGKIPDGALPYNPDNLVSQGRASDRQPLNFAGVSYDPWTKNSHWKPNYPVGMSRLLQANRVHVAANSFRYRRFHTDFGVQPFSNIWTDTGTGNFTDDKIYVVQSGSKMVERCLLMTTDPGDLVLDPTCGSGTTAYVAEQWGRRWITIDTSRVALALARARIMGARYPWYLLADSREGQMKEGEVTRSVPADTPTYGRLRQGFVYKRVPHITLKSIANNAEIDTIWESYQAKLEPLRAAINTFLANLRPHIDGTIVYNLLPPPTADDFQMPDEVNEEWSEEMRDTYREWRQHRATIELEKAQLNAMLANAEGDEREALQLKSKSIEAEGIHGDRHYAERFLKCGQEAEQQFRHDAGQFLKKHPGDLEEWELPREAPAFFSHEARICLAQWWDLRIARQREIDASIAAKADTEYLYDQPYEDKGRVRVAGPFTVESLSPHRVPAVDADDSLFDELEAAEGRRQPGPVNETADFAQMVLDNLKRSGVQQAHKADKLVFSSISPWPGKFVCAAGVVRQASEGEGDTLADSPDRRAAILVGPEYGTVARADLTAAAREAMEAGFDLLIAAAFNFDAHASEFTNMGALTVLQARINPDLHMPDLANTGAGNLFTVFGEPDIAVHDEGDGMISIEVAGVDMYKGGQIESSDADDIAVWFVDTDYNYESFFVRHAYFPGANDPYKALKTTLKAEIDADAWESLKRTRSRPFPKPAGGKVAVKVINHLGDEVMKVVGV